VVRPGGTCVYNNPVCHTPYGVCVVRVIKCVCNFETFDFIHDVNVGCSGGG